MAGDWIKMRINLDSNPHVIELASLLQLPELHIVGCLWKVWSWADSHSIDGNAIRVTDVTLDRFTSVPGFAAALRKVGWLEGRDNALSFPRFAEHNGQTAKNRAETAERVAKHRNAIRVTDVTQKPLPEKRREEKRRILGDKSPNTPSRLAEFNTNEVPESIRTPEFCETWKRWLDYRRQLGKSKAVTTEGQRSAFLRVETVGVRVAITKLNEAMSNGWQGWDFETKGGSHAKLRPGSQTAEVGERGL